MANYQLELHVLRQYMRQLAFLTCELRLSEAKELILQGSKDNDLSMEGYRVLDAFWDGLQDYEELSI